MKDSLKRIISLLLSLSLIIQLIPGIANSTNIDSKEITIDDIKKMSQNSELFHLEILKDAEGNAQISEDSISWKIVYNRSEEKLQKNKFELVLSEGLDLMYQKSNGDLDLINQPIYLNDSFETFESKILNDENLEYEIDENNINNEKKILSFSKKAEGIYDIQIDETETTEEIIFTTKIVDEDIKAFFSYIVLDGKEKLQSNSEVNIRPRTKIDIPVNIKWVDLKEGIELPEIEIELKNSDELIERRVLNPGLKDTLFEDLYKYDLKGREIEYSINQIPIEGFETSVLDYEITNRYIDEEIKVIEEEIKNLVGELLKPTEVEKRISSSENTLEEEKLDSIDDGQKEETIKEEITEEKITKEEKAEEVKEVKEKKAEIIIEESKEENKEENLELIKKEKEKKDVEKDQNEILLEEKINDDEKKIDNEVVLKSILTEDKSLMSNIDENVEIAPMSLFSTDILRGMPIPRNVIIPKTDPVEVGSGNNTIIHEWKGYANFDGKGNIIWTIDVIRIEGFDGGIAPNRIFTLGYNNPEPDVLDMPSYDLYYNDSLISTNNPITYPMPISTKTNYKKVTFKIITPIKVDKSEYKINVNPNISAATGYNPNNDMGATEIVLKKPKVLGNLKIKLTADEIDAIQNKGFIVKSGSIYNSGVLRTNSDGEILITDLDASLEYTVEQVDVHEGYNEDPKPIRTNVKLPANGTKLLEFNNTKKKIIDIGIDLKDDSGNPLDYGTFLLYNEANEIIGMLQGEIVQGKALFKIGGTNDITKVEAGKTYKIVQLVSKDGYKKSEDIIFTVPTNANDPHHVEIINELITNPIEKKITVKVYKPDGSNTVGLNDVQVSLFDENGSIFGGKFTDNNGMVEFTDIPFGTYKVRTMYIKNSSYEPAEEKAIVIDSISPMKEVNLVLKEKGDSSGPKVEFRYYDEISKSWELIPNTSVSFFVKNKDGITIAGPMIKELNKDFKKIEELTKNNEYIIQYYGINDNSDYLDKYYAFAPTEFTYNVDDEIWTVKLMERKAEENSKYTNKVHIKLTEDGTKALSGGRFRLEAISGDAFEMKYKYEGTTDAEGNLYFNELPKGKYKLTQIVVPYMHEESEVVIQDFTIDSEDKEFSVINKPIILPEPSELSTIVPEYNDDTEGEYSSSFYPEGDSFYRNRDNKIDNRKEPNYSIPAYSEYRGQGTNISEDKDVIENEKAFLWKYAEPSKKGDEIIPGEYFINLAIEGKEPIPPPTTDVVFVLDNSNSMNEEFYKVDSGVTSDNKISRMELLKQSVITLIDKTFPEGMSTDDINVRMGLVNFGNDFIDSQELTKDPLLLKSKLKDKGSGGTFTQEGLIKANQLLKDSVADNRLIVLISDGAPTKSYRLNNMTNIFGGTFGNASLLDGPEHIKGDGRFNDLAEKPSIPGSDDSVHHSYETNNGETNITEEIKDHNKATLSEAKNIKNNNIEIHTIGINVGGDTQLISSGSPVYLEKAKAEKNLKDISSGDGYSHFVNGTFFDQILWDIIPISDKSIVNGIITDPIGSQVILSNKHSFTQAPKTDEYLVNGDYHLEFSSKEVEDRFKKNGSKVVLEGNEIKFDKLTLGEREWVKLRYRVNLNTEDPEFNPDKFYLTNGKETTLEYNPKLSSEKYKFPSPAIKLPPINLKIVKEWVDFNQNEIPGSVSFNIIRAVKNNNGEYPPDTDWATVEENIVLNANTDPKWTWTGNGKYIRYNNEGKEYKYKVIENTVSNSYYVKIIENQEANGDYSFEVKNIAKKGSFLVIKTDDNQVPNYLSGAEFTLFKKDGAGNYVKVQGSNSQAPEITSENPQITDDYGQLEFRGLSSGTYYLKETKAPDGYTINETYLEIVVSSDDPNIVEFKIPANDEFWIGENGSADSIGYITLKDQQAYPLVIRKIDSEGNYITVNPEEFNAQFSVYNKEDYDPIAKDIKEGAIPVAKDLTIANNGTEAESESLFALNKEYYLKETRQPTGYVGLTEPVLIKLVESQGILDWTVVDEKYKDIVIGFNEGEKIGIYVVNEKINIPSTGGEGIRLFTTFGLILIGLAFIYRKRKLI